MRVVAGSGGTEAVLAFTRQAVRDINEEAGLAHGDRRINTIEACMPVAGAIGQLARKQNFDINLGVHAIDTRDGPITKLGIVHVVVASGKKFVDTTFGQYLPQLPKKRQHYVDAVVEAAGQDPDKTAGSLVLPSDLPERIVAISEIANAAIPELGAEAARRFSLDLMIAHSGIEVTPFREVNAPGRIVAYAPASENYETHVTAACEDLEFSGVLK